MYEDYVDFDVLIGEIVNPTGDMTNKQIVKLVEEKFTSTNTGSPKLLALADRAIAQLEIMSLHGALDTVKELRKQLRAGA